MNVKLRFLSVGVLCFTGHALSAQKAVKDTLQREAKIEEVVVQGYRTVTKKTAVTSTASISKETIENRPNANVMNVVQGQLAGVNITASSGQPGAKPQVVIRGVGSYGANTDPLYVIDGFPSNSDSFRSLNPNDIESMQVLKDATSIAEYGNRGSNGVIVIKTRQGRYGSGKLNFNYSSQLGVSFLQNQKYNYANSNQLLTLEKIYGIGLGSTMSDEAIADYRINTNWVDYFFRPAILSSHTLGVETGGKNFNSYTSVGYLNQDGLLKTTGLQRFNVRSNINGRSENNKFKYYLGIAAGFSKNNEATNLGEGVINRNYVTGAYLGAPYISPSEYQNSSQLHQLYQSNGTLLYTPLMLVDKINQYYNLTDETRLDFTSDVSYKVMEDLTAKMRVNAQLLSTRFIQSEFPNSFNALLFQATGQEFTGFEEINNRREFTYNNLFGLDYSKTFGNHTFNISGNLEYNFANLQIDNMRQRGLNPKTFVPGTGQGYIGDTDKDDFYVPVVSVSQARYNLISYFGNFDYDYRKKYGLVATARRDGTSRFIGNLQWGTFWSLGGRWNISEENFLKEISFINNLKIRGSIGTVGNQRIIDGPVFEGLNPPKYADIYGIPTETRYTYNNLQTYRIEFGDPQLRWETTKTYNIGLDWELYNRRFRGSFDYYNKKTIDLFMKDPTAPILGARFIVRNTTANLINKGYELNVAFDILKTENTTFTLRANAAMNNQKFDNYPVGLIDSQANPTYRSQNGNLPFTPYVYHYIGVNPENGNLLFEDINGNPTENPTDADRKLYKNNYFPKYQGGFGFDFEWKGFFATTTFTFVANVSRFDDDLANALDPSNLGTFNVSNDLLNAWTPTNRNTDVPALNAANLGAVTNSDRFLVNASYLRLRNVQLGYRLPKRLIQDTFINDVSIILQGENIYTWTKWKGFDPESSRNSDAYQYPTPRTFTLGFNIKF
ncbi:SusC/RagA family TonB-linked outer membrane protein [Chryseobacterium sp. T16E-39]|uniref:SusC/RagA family TonB-linked outer membrane protein n=1 Tax=Chryseobacterium sp. T16E-39 TaxID=2015076 RepID=UPI000B5B420A|nr:SusC/RagA family TonB-linked outer membrane protein [Chryseobacterium sp. T16E-39]ASK30194.1 SusC/RagA family TonB-linked outer membrane protein [Chryseobacterium sp. T16E-39]